ncbi:MAG: hypothetical protein F4Z92_03790 [Gemmatimonadetes bacterium]|nr:hypothetical protein [Gemmatimonadota bacterium]
MAGYADFHSHLIPGVDDGSQTLAEAVHSLERMLDAGITRVITTPHLSASIATTHDFAAYLGLFDRRWNMLRDVVRDRHPDLDFRRGFEVRLDAAFPDTQDERLRLGGTRFVLVEWHGFRAHGETPEMLERIAAGGLTPVVAHPERYYGIDERLDVVRAWKSAGAFLQGNYGSLAGQNGPRARDLLIRLLREGLLDYLCSDFHGRPDYTLYFPPGAARLQRLGGAAQLELLGKVNPGRLFEDRPPFPVPPLVVDEQESDRFASGSPG